MNFSISGGDGMSNMAEYPGNGFGANQADILSLKRKKWLFGDTPKGAMASTQLYSLAKTVKANGYEPYAWLRHALESLPLSASIEDYGALLPWNCSPASFGLALCPSRSRVFFWSAYSHPALPD